MISVSFAQRMPAGNISPAVKAELVNSKVHLLVWVRKLPALVRPVRPAYQINNHHNPPADGASTMPASVGPDSAKHHQPQWCTTDRPPAVILATWVHANGETCSGERPPYYRGQSNPLKAIHRIARS